MSQQEDDLLKIEKEATLVRAKTLNTLNFFLAIRRRKVFSDRFSWSQDKVYWGLNVKRRTCVLCIQNGTFCAFRARPAFRIAPTTIECF